MSTYLGEIRLALLHYTSKEAAEELLDMIVDYADNEFWDGYNMALGENNE